MNVATRSVRTSLKARLRRFKINNSYSLGSCSRITSPPNVVLSKFNVSYKVQRR